MQMLSIDKTKYKILDWKNFMMLHWIINPGLAINELIFGQRIPKIMLIEKDSKKSYAEKSFIPCPHCHTIHSGLKWSVQNGTAFNNWFGLYCDNCGKIIPCLRNLTGLVILAATFPFWYWFKDQWKEKWLIIQKEKFAKPLNLFPPKVKWWTIGLRFSVAYFIIDRLFSYLVMQDNFSWKKLIGHAVSSLILGVIFGFFFKNMMLKKSAKPGRTQARQASLN